MMSAKRWGSTKPNCGGYLSLRRNWISARLLLQSTPVIAFLSFLCMVAPSRAAVNLEWRPLSQPALQNSVVDVGLYAVLDATGLNAEIGAIEVILSWDPSKLELVGKVDNSSPNYVWFISTFPDDHLQDGLNAPYTPGGTPANDGTAWYNALSQLGAGNEAVATTGGILVTTFRFRALALGTALVSMPATAGAHTHTRVLDGITPGLVTTGLLGPSASIITSAGSVPAPPVADPTADKCRFISFAPDNLGQQTALRVTMVSLHHVGLCEGGLNPNGNCTTHAQCPGAGAYCNYPYTGGPTTPFAAFEGQSAWVGPPKQFLESTASGVPFWESTLQCAPYYQDWGTISLLHVTGSAIVPSSIYDVEALASDCAGSEDTCALVSVPVTIGTTRWGDVELPYNPPVGTTQPDLSDISALVNKFKDAPGAPIKARAILAPRNAFGDIPDAAVAVNFSFTDIASCVNAFRGVPYPAKMGQCTGAPFAISGCLGVGNPVACCTGIAIGTCTGACTNDSECADGNGTPPCILATGGSCTGSPNGLCRYDADCLANSSCIGPSDPKSCCTGAGAGTCPGAGPCDTCP